MCRYYSAKVFLFKCKFVGIGAFSNRNGIAFVHFSCKNLLANTIFNVVLNGTFQRSCSKLNIVSLFSNQFFGFVCNGYVVAKFLYSFKQPRSSMSIICFMAARSSWSKVIISSKRLRNSGANCLLKLFCIRRAHVLCLVRYAKWHSYW